MVSFLNFWVSSTTSLINQFLIKTTCSKFCLYMFSHYGAEKTLVFATGVHSLQCMFCALLDVRMYSTTNTLYLATPLIVVFT